MRRSNMEEKYITLSHDNIEHEHICCGMTDKKAMDGNLAKKAWIKEQLDAGYTFTKLDVRGKVFIEYCPSEIAYMPITAHHDLVINCLWVSGRYKGQGYAKKLLEQCIEEGERQKRNGIIALVSDKKRPFLSDKKFFIKQGFVVCDHAKPYFELLYLPLTDEAVPPRFLDHVREGSYPSGEEGFHAYYAHQCPYMHYYIEQQKQVAESLSIPYEATLLDTREKGVASPSPFTTYSLFYRGTFITQELMAEKKFKCLIEGLINEEKDS